MGGLWVYVILAVSAAPVVGWRWWVRRYHAAVRCRVQQRMACRQWGT